jgi:methylmalonyl-CoA mutase cobalamin-binding domain/chain
VSNNKENEIIKKLKKAIGEGEVDTAPEITQEALNAGVTAERLREKAISQGIAELEEKLYGNLKVWGNPYLFMGMEAARRCLQVLQPKLKPRKSLGTVVLGTPQGDVHDVGGKMVAIALTAAGFEVVYLGRDVPLTLFIHKVQERSADILAISSYQTSGFSRIEKILELLTAARMRDRVKVMVGGVTVSGKFARQYGLLYANTASGAVRLAKECLTGK